MVVFNVTRNGNPVVPVFVISTFPNMLLSLCIHRTFLLTSESNLVYFTREQLITARKQSLRRLCFYTCLSFCSRGGGRCLPQCMLGYTLSQNQRQTPPRPEAYTPRSRHRSRYEQQTGGKRSTGMHTCWFMFPHVLLNFEIKMH